MRAPQSGGLPTICWSCALRLQYTAGSRCSLRAISTISQGPKNDRLRASSGARPLKAIKQSRTALRDSYLAGNRSYYADQRHRQVGNTQSHAHAPSSDTSGPREPIVRFHGVGKGRTQKDPNSRIRTELRAWNEQHGHDPTVEISDMSGDADQSESINSFTRLGDGNDLQSPKETTDSERDELTHFTQASVDDLEDLDPQHRFLRKGDLVELEFPRSEKDSLIAVFVRRIGAVGQQCQFYTVQGKWVHLPERQVQYAIPGYMDPELIDKIIPHLPAEEMNDELMDRAVFFDLSVPREVSAPIVSRLLEFQRESEDTYRQYASRLDNAHNLLAHATNLKFGSLEQIATKLLGKTESEDALPLTALFTVRKALAHAGFAFGADRRSHRLTGFLQIRSREQVRMVEGIRNWLREWQDAIAAASASGDRQPEFSGRAKHVSDFIEKAKLMVQRSRTLRDVTSHGTVGPSKVRHTITPEQNATAHLFEGGWTNEDNQLIKFMEGWACSNIYLGLPRLDSLPPLILQATGMYQDMPLNQATGFVFLQEIGLLVPYENRIRFDQHLLLPSSQHSRPLEQLMTTVQKLENDHGFVDSMRDIRHDWKDLPVFCIDSEGAHEIDDGLSVEPAGKDQYWLHMHIANPTAFFDGNSPLAKMARHMTETIYMPERAFVMLPRWCSKQHFSLGPNRPCLTFSAKLDSSGEYLEHKITPGIVRNVRLISPQEVSKALGLDGGQSPDVSLRVGGDPPEPRKKPRTKAADLSPQHISMLQTIQKLAEKRQARRRSAGGIFLNSHEPDITVWNSFGYPGLGWDMPSRVKSRFVEGDPIIEYRSKELSSWFESGEGVSDILVREMMLLACEIGARWCSERNIPIIYRGSIPRPETTDAKTYHDTVLAPAAAKNGGAAPMHLAFQYLRHTGATALMTEPRRHQVLGLDHYTKATSPLRRYGDMLLHWQIEAALREEAQNGSLVGSSKTDFLPFSAQNLKQVMVGLQPREAMIRRAMIYANDCWASQLFFRAFHYGECELPATLTAYVFFQPLARMRTIQVMIKEYSINAAMLRPETLGLDEAKAGDWIEVAIDSVNVFGRSIVVKPLRIIDRWED